MEKAAKNRCSMVQDDKYLKIGIRGIASFANDFELRFLQFLASFCSKNVGVSVQSYSSSRK